MRINLLHAILSGITLALVLGFALIPTLWQVIIPQNGGSTFGPEPNSTAIMKIILSVVVIAVILLSFKLIKKLER